MENWKERKSQVNGSELKSKLPNPDETLARID